MLRQIIVFSLCNNLSIMKQLLLSAAMIFSLSGTISARIVTTQANGNATNPFTWDCLCVPVDGDTIIINHALTLDVDYAFTMGGVQINASGSVTGNASNRIFGVSGGYFLNNGTMNMGYVFHNGGTFTNNTTITVTLNAGFDQAVTTINNGTLNVNDTLLINTLATFQNNGTVNCPEILNAGTYNNSGTTVADNFWSSGTLTHSSGLIQLAMSIYNTGNITFSAPSTITLDIWNAENFTANYYISARSLYNGDTVFGTATFTNNAVISLSQDLLNSETLAGNGDFCVANTTSNSGAVNGTLDICDLTGGNWDLNSGTVAGTVTYCSSSCTIGIDENSTMGLSLVPNPADNFIDILLPSNSSGTLQVIDFTGRVVIEMRVVSDVRIDISELAPGIYSVMLINDDAVMSEKLVIEK